MYGLTDEIQELRARIKELEDAIRRHVKHCQYADNLKLSVPDKHEHKFKCECGETHK